jgi:septation ring formation regulator EzrA
MTDDRRRPTSSPEGMWWVLDRIQDDLDKMEDKWDANIASMTKVTENLAVVSTKVQEVNKLLTVDDGSPSVVTQLRAVTSDVKDIKQLLNSLRESVDAVKEQTGANKTPKEVQVERLKAWGSTVGMLALVVPGLISFVRDFM